MANPQGPVSGSVKSYIYDSAITAGCAVAFGATPGHVAAVTAAGQVVAGIADQTGPAGFVGRVTRSGDTSAQAGGALTHGQYVKADINGRLVPVAGPSGSGENIVGRSESDAVNVGDLVTVFIAPSIL